MYYIKWTKSTYHLSSLISNQDTFQNKFLIDLIFCTRKLKSKNRTNLKQSNILIANNTGTPKINVVIYPDTFAVERTISYISGVQ